MVVGTGTAFGKEGDDEQASGSTWWVGHHLRWRDALFVAALGVGLGAAAHLLSHLIDRELGGRPAVDFPGLALLAIALLVAAIRRRHVAREGY